MSNISVPRNVLAALINMAKSHVQDIESGIEDGTYDAAENKDLGEKQQVVETADVVYRSPGIHKEKQK